MHVGADWYRDPDSVIAEMRREREERCRAPEIGGYEFIREIGRGGQGVVFLARQRSTGQCVALKVLLDGRYASAEARRRFEREIETVARLRHPNIVRVYDSGVDGDGRPYCVMEYVEGTGLDAWVGSAPDGGEIETRLTCFAAICDAVHHAHRHGVIHRDLKPGNIILDEENRPHILDFGLARVDDDVRPIATATGQFAGSLPWASPEQAEGRNADIDVRTDVYALGVLFYQLLTGRFPYDVDGNLREIISRIVECEPVPPSRHHAGLDEDLAIIALKCLAKEPDRRYDNAGMIASDIRFHLAGEPITARRDSTWYLLRKKVRRYRLASALLAALMVVALAFAGVSSVLYGQAVEARDRESQEARKAQRVQQFLEEMISSADPAVTQGQDSTILRVILDEAAGRAASELADEPLVEAPVRATIGRTYHSLGLLEPARRHLEAALDLFKQELGNGSPRTVNAAVELSNVLIDENELAAARGVIEFARDEALRALGENHVGTLAALCNEALLLNYEGRLDESLAMHRENLETLEAIGESDGEMASSTMNHIGLVLQELGRPEEAEAWLRRVVEKRQGRLGPDHPRTMTAENNLAGLLHELGRLDEADAIQQDVLERQVAVLGEEHPLTQTSLNNIAHGLLVRGRPDEALPIFQRLLDLRIATYGRHNSGTVVAMNNLSRTLHEAGRLDESEKMAREALELAKETLGSDHPDVAWMFNSLGGIVQARGDFVEAETLFREAVSRLSAQREPGHTFTLTAMNNLAGVLADQGRYDEAIDMHHRLIALGDAHLPEGHWYIGIFKSLYGRTLMLAGRLDEAEAVLRESLGIMEATFGEGHERAMLVVRRLENIEAMRSEQE